MQSPSRKTAVAEFIRMFIEGFCGLVEVSVDSEKNFGKESANLCSPSTGLEQNLMHGTSAKALRKIFKGKSFLTKTEFTLK